MILWKNHLFLPKRHFSTKGTTVTSDIPLLRSFVPGKPLKLCSHLAEPSSVNLQRCDLDKDKALVCEHSNVSYQAVLSYFTVSFSCFCTLKLKDFFSILT